MKKIYMSLSLLLLTFAGFSQNQTYPGNGNTGFGDDIGTGNLNITYDGTNLNFTMTKGAGQFNDVLVIYIDNGAGGGFSTTSGFMDVSSGLSKAISGYTATDNGGGPGLATLNFPTGFAPQYGLAFQANGSAGAVLDQLANGATLTNIAMPALSNNGNNSATTYSLAITPAQIGLSAPFSFKFAGTIISNTAYRSNEAVGINFPTGTNNIAWTTYSDTSAALVFTSSSLAVNFGNFTGFAKGNTVTLDWNTKSEVNLSQFNVLKSTDGVHWNTIGNVSARNIITGSSYSFVDNNATASKNYYRLQSMNKDASFTYSSVLIVSKTGGHNVTILGNPVLSEINLNISDDAAKNYTLSLYSSDGKLLATQIFSSAVGTSKATVNIPAGVKGMCILKVTSNETSESFRVMVE